MSELKISILFDDCTVPVIIPIQTKEPMTAVRLQKQFSAAVSDFITTPKGAAMFAQNGNTFTWSQAVQHLPNRICRKYGFLIQRPEETPVTFECQSTDHIPISTAFSVFDWNYLVQKLLAPVPERRERLQEFFQGIPYPVPTTLTDITQVEKALERARFHATIPYLLEWMTRMKKEA